MKKWEYMVIKLDNVLSLGGTIETGDPAQLLHRMLGGLNALGGDGWEMVSMNVQFDMLVFKREIPNEPSEVVGDSSSGALQSGEVPDQTG
jgi:hypothetical protein